PDRSVILVFSYRSGGVLQLTDRLEVDGQLHDWAARTFSQLFGWSPTLTVDYDGDGTSNVVLYHTDSSDNWRVVGVAFRNGSLVLEEMEGDVWSVFGWQPPEDEDSSWVIPSGSMSPLVLDANGDGLQDFVVLKRKDDREEIPATATLYLSTGRGWERASSHVYDEDVDYWSEATVLDVNGDGRQEILVLRR